MKVDQAFRVAVIPNMRTATLIEINHACDRARLLAQKIVAPLQLGPRLQFGLNEDTEGRGWLRIDIQRSGQQSLLEEFEAMDLQSGALEAQSAAALLKQYVGGLKKLMRQINVSGCELAEFADGLPDLASLQAAFGMLSHGQRRVTVACGGICIEDFALSHLPGRFILPQVHHVNFWVKMIGVDEAKVVVAQAARVPLGVRRREFMLRWDRSTVDHRTWRRLVWCMKRRWPLEARVKLVLKSKGQLAELIAVRIINPAAAITVPDRALA
jgi:hypothetical protein